MSRPFTDIAKIDNALDIHNGSLTVSTTPTGKSQQLSSNPYVKTTPTIESIASKYGYRFHNGIFVELTGDQTIIGG
jgi:hypothetical protein